MIRKRKDIISEGLELCEETIENGGWREYFYNDKNPNDKSLWIEDERIRALTAILLENERHDIEAMDESTRLAQIGGFIDYIYPTVRAVFPNLIAHELFSVQPLQQENGQITYLNFVYGNTKGANYVQGQRMFDAQTGYPDGDGLYTSETVNSEVVGAGTGAATVYAYNLGYIPVRAGKIRITHTQGGVVIADGVDSGNGVITGTNIAAGLVNYETGLVNLTFTLAPDNLTNIVCTYEYDSEVSPTTPLIDVAITSSAITAIRHALRFRYSLDALHEHKAQFGADLGDIIRSGMAAIVASEIDRRLIEKAWSSAGTPIATFSQTVPGAISRVQHYGDIVVPLNQASEAIYQDTHRGNVSWIVCDANAATIIESAINFVKDPVRPETVGAYKIGSINGIPVYKERNVAALTGAVANGNILVGYKGGDWLTAGLVYAPYRMFYFTPEMTFDDWFRRGAMASKFGMKLVNGRMFKRISIVP